MSAVKDHVKRSGGCIIFFNHVLRLFLVLVLLGLSVFSFLREEASEQEQHIIGSSLNSLRKHWGKRPKHKHSSRGGSLSELEWLDFALCLTYVCPLSALPPPPLE